MQLGGVQAKPVLVAPVDVTVASVAAHVSHQRGDGVGDEPHLLFAAQQGGRAFSHARLQQGIVFLNQSLRVTLLGDIRVQRHETMVGHRYAAHPQHHAIGPVALNVMGRKGAGSDHPLRDLLFRVALTVFAAIRIEADESLKRCTDVSHLLREIQQPQERLVPGHHAKVLVDQGEALVNQVQAGLKGLVALQSVSCGG